VRALRLTVVLALATQLGAAPAHADDPLNHEWMLHLQLVHATGQAQPWGVRLGASDLYAIGDHCSYRETDCRSGRGLAASLWPLAGAAGSLEWRGGPRLAVELSAEGGLGSLDMHQYGFIPYWQAIVAPGFRYSVDQGPMLALRGYLSKSLSARFFTPDTQSYRVNSLEVLDLRVDLGTGWGGRALSDSGWAPPVLAVGLQSATMAGDFL